MKIQPSGNKGPIPTRPPPPSKTGAGRKAQTAREADAFEGSGSKHQSKVSAATVRQATAQAIRQADVALRNVLRTIH